VGVLGVEFVASGAATVLLTFVLTLLLEDTADLVSLPLELFASVVPLLELE
tara:strand:+ start:370 stop:522 length:153 start_codon:yes stop_codon:yes gene_type:complete